MYESIVSNASSPAQNGESVGKYVAHVLDPEHAESTRIPSPFPIQTALQTLDRVDTLATDNAGNLLIRATFPDLLTLGVANAVSYCNDSSWATGTNDDTLLALNSLVIAGAGYANDARYRLVAYKIKLRYIGAELNRSGIFFGCHDFSQNFAYALSASSVAQMQDGPYFEMHPTSEGIEVIYKPYDNSYLEFGPKLTGTTPSTAANNVWHTPYTLCCGILGGQTNSVVVLVEQFATIEWIPGRASQDTVELKEFPGNPQAVAMIDNKDVIRTANETQNSPGLLSKVTGFITNLAHNDIFKTLGKGVLNTLSILPGTAPIMAGGKLLTSSIMGNSDPLSNFVKQKAIMY